MYLPQNFIWISQTKHTIVVTKSDFWENFDILPSNGCQFLQTHRWRKLCVGALSAKAPTPSWCPWRPPAGPSSGSRPRPWTAAWWGGAGRGPGGKKNRPHGFRHSFPLTPKTHFFINCFNKEPPSNYQTFISSPWEKNMITLVGCQDGVRNGVRTSNPGRKIVASRETTHTEKCPNLIGLSSKSDMKNDVVALWS